MAWLKDGCVLWLQFDEEKGDVVYDQSGIGNNGVIYGATRVKGKIGGALSFDGVDDYMKVESSPSLNLLDRTEMVWLKFSPLAVYNTILSKRPQTDTEGYWWSYTASSGTRIGWQYADGTKCYSKYWSFDFTDELWHHVAFVKSGETIRCFIDGIDRGVYNIPNALNEEGYPLFIGRYQGSTYPFSGIIDEVRIYNRALSAKEIFSHYMYALTHVKRA